MEGLRPLDGSDYEDLYKRFFDISFGPVLKGHLPIQIRRVLLDLGLGVKFGFVNGYLFAKPNADYQEYIRDDSRTYHHRHYGPEVTGIFNADLFITPKFGFGIELRAIGTLYQQVCFDHGDEYVCRGTKDDTENKAIAPFKLGYGIHLIYYL